MDHSRFDLIARAIGAVTTRRSVFGLLSVLSIDGVLLQTQDADAKRKRQKNTRKSCPPGRLRCGKTCCKRDETCKKGTCVHHCRDGKKNFGETDIDCGGTCVDIPSGAGTCGIRERCAVNTDCFTLFCGEASPGAKKTCLQCRTDSDCAAGDPSQPRCIGNFCHDCAADFDCPAQGDAPEMVFCVAPVEARCPNNAPCVCRECRRDTDCPEGSFCDDVLGRCDDDGCDSNEDCRAGVACVDGVCAGTCAPPGPCANCANNPNVSCCNFLCGGVTCCDFGQICNQQTKRCV
jgi:Cys-rich repeat protein